jgi:hypothetical protein
MMRRKNRGNTIKSEKQRIKTAVLKLRTEAVQPTKIGKPSEITCEGIDMYRNKSLLLVDFVSLSDLEGRRTRPPCFFRFFHLVQNHACSQTLTLGRFFTCE